MGLSSSSTPSYGSVSKCVQAQLHPTQPNPKSVTVAHVTGAGDFASAAAALHFASGKTQSVSVAVYRQGGSWRLLGLKSG